jgi:hypothetical protein
MTAAPTPRNQNLCIWVTSTCPRVDMGSVNDVSAVHVTPIFRVEVSWVSQRSLQTVLLVWTGHLSPSGYAGFIQFSSALNMEAACTSETSATLTAFRRCKDPRSSSTTNHRGSLKSVKSCKVKLCAKVAQVRGQRNTQQWPPGGSCVPRPCGLCIVSHLHPSCSRKLVITRTQPEPAVGMEGGEVGSAAARSDRRRQSVSV